MARALGADVVIDRHTQDFVEVVKEVTGGRGADVVYDPVGGDTYTRSTKCIAFEGRILIIGFAGGQIQSAALNHALIKNYSIVGLHWGLYQSKNPQLIRRLPRAADQARRRGRHPAAGQRAARARRGARRAAAPRRRRHGRPDCLRPLTRRYSGFRVDFFAHGALPVPQVTIQDAELGVAGWDGRSARTAAPTRLTGCWPRDGEVYQERSVTVTQTRATAIR